MLPLLKVTLPVFKVPATATSPAFTVAPLRIVLAPVTVPKPARVWPLASWNPPALLIPVTAKIAELSARLSPTRIFVEDPTVLLLALLERASVPAVTVVTPL